MFMKQHQSIRTKIPGLGQRSLKTALAAVVLALVYYPLNREPTFACIGIIFGMGNNMEDSRLNGGNRLIGTIIGGVVGMTTYWLEHLIQPEGNYLLKVFLVFIGIIILVWSAVAFRWPGAVQPGGVVLCIIMFSTPANHIFYAFNRMLDTAIGVIFALAINRVITRERIDRLMN